MELNLLLQLPERLNEIAAIAAITAARIVIIPFSIGKARDKASSQGSL